MRRKVYRLKTFPQTTYNITLSGGRIYPVRFSNATLGGSFKRNGYFMTEDPELQRALENDPQLDKLFYLEQTVEIPAADSEDIAEDIPLYGRPPDEDIAEEAAEVEAYEPDEDTSEDAPPSADGITNYTGAKEYLRKYYGVEPGETRNAADTRAKAEALGVTFPDWKK